MQELKNKVFSKINFLEKYTALSNETRKNEIRLNATEKKEVLKILELLGYKAKYVAKGSFYRIFDEVENWIFNIHFSLKNGLVEVILGLKEINEKQGLGGTACSICEDIQYYKGIKFNGYIKDPSFADYASLSKIFKECLFIYEDMKKEVLSSSYPLA